MAQKDHCSRQILGVLASFLPATGAPNMILTAQNAFLTALPYQKQLPNPLYICILSRISRGCGYCGGLPASLKKQLPVEGCISERLHSRPAVAASMCIHVWTKAGWNRIKNPRNRPFPDFG